MLMERLVSLFRWSGRLPLRRFGFSIRSNYSQKVRNQTRRKASFTSLSRQSLSALLRVDLVEDKSAEEISEVISCLEFLRLNYCFSSAVVEAIPS